MPAHIIYRTSKTAPIQTADIIKNSPLTSVEIDGNFKSLKDAIELLENGSGSTGTGSTTINQTNLSTTVSSTNVVIVSDTGTSATINAASKSLAGVMSAADKIKLDGLSSTGTGSTTTSSVVVNSYQFVADGTQSTFVLSESIDDKNSTQIYNNGIYQEKSKYTINNTSLSFNSAPIKGSIEVVTFSVDGNSTGSGSGSGSTTINQTNLSVNSTASSVTINSDTGKSATINAATTTSAGTMSAADKIKLDGLSSTGTGSTTINQTNLSTTVNSTDVVIASDTGTSATIPLVSQSFAGVMSPSDKIKLDGLSSTSTNKVKIVVIGDSLSAQADVLHEPWPILLERSLIAGGLDCIVYNLAILGHTFELAVTDKVYGGKSQVDRAIELNADVVIVALGANDTITAAASPKTNSAIQSDANNLFAKLRTGLPLAKLIYAREVGWDITHKPSGTGLQNKHVATAFMSLPTTGYLTGCYSSQILDNSLTTYSGRFSNWMAVDSYIRNLTTLNGTFILDHYKCARLGLVGEDGVHLTAEGANMFAGWARKAFNTIPALSNIATSLRIQTKVAAINAAAYDDPDEVFKLFCTSNGSTEWIDNPQNDLARHISTNHAMIRAIRSIAWFMPSRGYLSTGLSTVNSSGVATWTVENAQPNTAVYVSVNGATWSDSTFKTSARGDVTFVQPHAHLLSGTNNFYAKIGNEVFGPYNLTVTSTSQSSDYNVFVSTSTASITAGVETSIASWTKQSNVDSGTVKLLGNNTFTIPAGTWVVSLSIGVTLPSAASTYASVKPSSMGASELSIVTCSSAHNPAPTVGYGVTAGSSIVYLNSETNFSVFIIATNSIKLNDDNFAHKLTFHKIA